MKHLDLETVAKIDANIDTSDWRWAPTGVFDWIACGILLLSLVYAFTVDVQTFISWHGWISTDWPKQADMISESSTHHGARALSYWESWCSVRRTHSAELCLERAHRRAVWQ
jgi:hypothetical protein